MPPSRKYSDPDAIARIADLTLRSRRLVEGAISGMHRSPFHGFNIEFASYREYTAGDDLRRLDWRVFARSDRHYIKQYEEESNVRVTFVMDASASMKYKGSAALSKFDYASTLVVALSMLLTRQQDPVGLVLFDEAATTVLPPYATQAQVAVIAGLLERCTPARKTEVGGLLRSVTGQLRRRSLLVIVADLFTEGIGFDGSSIRGFQKINESDMLLLPDPDTAFLDPACTVPTLSVICDVIQPGSMERYSRDPRFVAKKAEAFLTESGIATTAYFGPEVEFYIFNSIRFGQDQRSGFYEIDSEEGIWNSSRNSAPNLGYRPSFATLAQAQSPSVEFLGEVRPRIPGPSAAAIRWTATRPRDPPRRLRDAAAIESLRQPRTRGDPAPGYAPSPNSPSACGSPTRRSRLPGR